MMKVWVLSIWDHWEDQLAVSGVFSSEESAKEYAELARDGWYSEIKECEVIK